MCKKKSALVIRQNVYVDLFFNKAKKLIDEYSDIA